MLWTPPTYHYPHSYKCNRCTDVYGKGKKCWLCGGVDLEMGVTPCPVGQHHHDPKCKSVTVGNGRWEIRRGLTRLLT